jgi:adenylylsulfate kinase
MFVKLSQKGGGLARLGMPGRRAVPTGLLTAPALFVFVNLTDTRELTQDAGAFEDTNRLFSPPEKFDSRMPVENTVEYWVDQIAQRVRPIFDPQRPTALVIGRSQPFHDGHKALIEEGLRRVGQVCMAVRDTAGVDDKNPFSFDYVRAHIEHGFARIRRAVHDHQAANISHVFYGRDVGYQIARIDLDQPLEAISATQIRNRIQPVT